MQQNRFLLIAILLSLLAHGALLAVRFAAPAPLAERPADPGLEVILVNAKHAAKPLKAEALAQANLDGGGNAEAGRAKSPLPDLRKMANGASVAPSSSRIAALEKQRNDLLTQIQHPSPLSVAPLVEQSPQHPLPAGQDLLETSKALARMSAEISQSIDDQNKRPRKTFITPSTQEVGYAMYYKAMQKRIEEIGTLNFPQQNGRKLYGELVVQIPVFMDGEIYQKEGGIQIKQSSGNPALDNAALAIVRRAAPFGRFPPNMLSRDKDDLWVIITRFKFTREEKMESKLSEGGT